MLAPLPALPRKRRATRLSEGGETGAEPRLRLLEARVAISYSLRPPARARPRGARRVHAAAVASPTRALHAVNFGSSCSTGSLDLLFNEDSTILHTEHLLE